MAVTGCTLREVMGTVTFESVCPLLRAGPAALTRARAYTSSMKIRLPLRILCGTTILAGALLLARPGGAIEVAPDTFQGRTEAAIAEFRAAIELEPDLAHGAELFESCARCLSLIHI